MSHSKETSIVIRMDKAEADVLFILLGELVILKDEWTDIERKVFQDIQDILSTY